MQPDPSQPTPEYTPPNTGPTYPPPYAYPQQPYPGGPQNPQYPPYPGYYAGPMPPPTSGLAIAAIVCAFVFPIAGIILGHLALSEINRSNGQMEGHTMAVVALVISYAFVALGLCIGAFVLISVITAFNSSPSSMLLALPI